jgi:hypothetical protein
VLRAAVTRWDEPEAERADSHRAVEMADWAAVEADSAVAEDEKLHWDSRADSRAAPVADSLRVFETACWRSKAG